MGRPLEVEDVPEPIPGPEEVLVEVDFCGVCASDLHVRDGSTPAARLPLILGHEAAGRVIAGPDGFARGDWVVLLPGLWCGRCEACGAGRENVCHRRRFLGVDVDGAFAERIAVPASSVLPVPPGVDPAQAALAGDAVATAFHALRRAGDLRGVSVAVFGAGGVGAHAVMLARILGAASVIVVDGDPVARARALDLGASRAVDPAESKPGRAVRELSAGGVEVAMEFIGNVETMSQATKSLKPGGRAVLVGLSPDELRLLPAAALVSSELEVVGSFGATKRELQELLDLMTAGTVDLGRSITHRMSLDDAERALEMLRSRDGHPLRIVLEIAGR